MKKQTIYGVLARCTMHGVPNLSARERRRLAAWLRRTARDVERRGSKYSKRYTATLYTP